MPLPRPQPRPLPVAAASLLLFSLIQCASPGPPRPPSLHLPRPVRDLTADRVGDKVELRFEVPLLSTDGLRLGGNSVAGRVCRAEANGPCKPLSGATLPRSFATRNTAGLRSPLQLSEDLPADLRVGRPRLLTYRVELLNEAGRSAGLSDPAFAVAGAAPGPLLGLGAEGSRRGVVLHWQPSSGSDATEVLVRRDTIAGTSTGPHAGKQGRAARASSAEGPEPPLWMRASDGSIPAAVQTLDTTAQPGTTYRYAAQRRRRVNLAGRSLEMRSELSAPVFLRFTDSYPPPAPTGLTAAGFGAGGAYAVDLVWEPVNDRGVAGYRVSRVTLDARGEPSGAPAELSAAAVSAPAFHDSGAKADLRYRYTVVAVDANGLQSAGTAVVVEPHTGP